MRLLQLNNVRHDWRKQTLWICQPYIQVYDRGFWHYSVNGKLAYMYSKLETKNEKKLWGMRLTAESRIFQLYLFLWQAHHYKNEKKHKTHAFISIINIIDHYFEHMCIQVTHKSLVQQSTKGDSSDFVKCIYKRHTSHVLAWTQIIPAMCCCISFSKYARRCMEMPPCWSCKSEPALSTSSTETPSFRILKHLLEFTNTFPSCRQCEAPYSPHGSDETWWCIELVW